MMTPTQFQTISQLPRRAAPNFVFVTGTQSTQKVLTFQLKESSLSDLMWRLYVQLEPNADRETTSFDALKFRLNETIAQLNHPILLITGWEKLSDPIADLRLAVDWLTESPLHAVAFLCAVDISTPDPIWFKIGRI